MSSVESPDSVIRTKRRNPFGDTSPLQRKTLVKNLNMQEIYEKTLTTLMSSGGDAANAQPNSYAASFEGDHIDACCSVCRQHQLALPCSFCDRYTCDSCLRQCEQCHDIFCCFCSIINYELRNDRIFCLTCNTEEQRRSRAPMNSPNSMGHKASHSAVTFHPFATSIGNGSPMRTAHNNSLNYSTASFAHHISYDETSGDAMAEYSSHSNSNDMAE